MEKLVLIEECGDGCSWSATNTLPFEYESKEKAEFDLLELWENYIKKREQNISRYIDQNVKFGGHEINLLNFTYWKEDKLHKCKIAKFMENQIFTLEEWFEQNKLG